MCWWCTPLFTLAAKRVSVALFLPTWMSSNKCFSKWNYRPFSQNLSNLYVRFKRLEITGWNATKKSTFSWWIFEQGLLNLTQLKRSLYRQALYYDGTHNVTSDGRVFPTFSWPKLFCSCLWPKGILIHTSTTKIFSPSFPTNDQWQTLELKP